MLTLPQVGTKKSSVRTFLQNWVRIMLVVYCCVFVFMFVWIKGIVANDCYFSMLFWIAVLSFFSFNVLFCCFVFFFRITVVLILSFDVYRCNTCTILDFQMQRLFRVSTTGISKTRNKIQSKSVNRMSTQAIDQQSCSIFVALLHDTKIQQQDNFPKRFSSLLPESINPFRRKNLPLVQSYFNATSRKKLNIFIYNHTVH